MPTLDENIQIPDKNSEMQRIQAIVHCGAANIFTLRLLMRRGISHRAADITTLTMNGGVIQHSQDTGRRFVSQSSS
jgi:hypothetical protein